MTHYPKPKPEIPVQIYFFVGLVLFGLFAMFFAALAAFEMVSPNWLHAFFSAILIEAGMVGEVVGFTFHKTRGGKAAAFVGGIISISVSGIYNYLQASQKAIANVEAIGFAIPWYALWALAIGPLAVLTFMAYNFGLTITAYQESVEKWEDDKATWLELRRTEAEQQAQAGKKQVEDTAAAEAEAKRKLEEEIAFKRLQMEYTLAKQRQDAEIAEARAESRRKARAEHPEVAGKPTGSPAILPEISPETTGNKKELPAILPEGLDRIPTSINDFRAMVKSGEARPDQLTGMDLFRVGAVNSDKNGRLWLAEFKQPAPTNGNGNGNHA